MHTLWLLVSWWKKHISERILFNCFIYFPPIPYSFHLNFFCYFSIVYLLQLLTVIVLVSILQLSRSSSSDKRCSGIPRKEHCRLSWCVYLYIIRAYRYLYSDLTLALVLLTSQLTCLRLSIQQIIIFVRIRFIILYWMWLNVWSLSVILTQMN